jgi:hypothetical protein
MLCRSISILQHTAIELIALTSKMGPLEASGGGIMVKLIFLCVVHTYHTIPHCWDVSSANATKGIKKNCSILSFAVGFWM